MTLTPVDTHLDLSDPDLLAARLPLDEFAWLRRNSQSGGIRNRLWRDTATPGSGRSRATPTSLR